MPKDLSIQKVLVIGSGPIVIGQAAEFDYSGTQACKTLKEEGVEVVLINSNPATIMTDPGIADKVYVEPITIEYVEKIIHKERPDAMIAGMGGQTGLNMAVELYDSGILEKYGIRVLGTTIDSIKKGEDRELFRNLMNEIGQPIPPSKIVTNIEDALKFVGEIGYPVVVRPAYTLGGTGGGIAENEREMREIISHGLQLSRAGQVLLEKSIKGWKEIEYEVIRDSFGNKIVVCNMENIDPVGIHTGDSIVVAPTQTLSAKECAIMRQASMDILEAVGIVGGCNVQLALNPRSFEYVVIEINPRVSRSSALASKATGYPIAKVATRIALGYALDEISNDLTGKTKACNEPSVDYVVIKIPKWPFDKFRKATRTLGTKMMATGEVMAIGNTFEAAFLKALRSLEIKQFGLYHHVSTRRSSEELKSRVRMPDDQRIFDLAELLRRNYRIDMVCKLTGMDEFFVNKIKGIVDYEERLRHISFEGLTAELLRNVKKKGFSDKAIANLLNCSPNDVYELRKTFKIQPVYKMVDTCSGEVDPMPAYFYSTYDLEDEVEVSDKRKVIVIGSGPIRIGQGVEFDYCSVHGVKALKKQGIETIIINNNPETVSTDFDIADKLYFEPLTEEDVLNIIEKEKPYGVILQFGGQTAIKLARFLKEKNILILGTSPEAIDEAEDREKFEALLEKCNIRRPKGTGVTTVDAGLSFAEEVGFPVLVRPSYVLGGQGMEITYNLEELRLYLESAFEKEKDLPVLVDRYILGREIEVDAICDGEDILIPGIMEHLERAGVHSGDSISIYPTINVTNQMKDELRNITKEVAKELNVIGMINIQFIEANGQIYIIEVNPRSSRTVPYISKVTGIPIIEVATRVVLGEKLKDMEYGTGLYREIDKFAVKVPVFSTQKLPNVEVSLGPEMRSTGEVLGVGQTLEEALFKGFLASGSYIPKKGGTIVATIRSRDQKEFSVLAKELFALGYQFVATEGTAKALRNAGIEVAIVNKIKESHDNILTKIQSGTVDMVINTPTKANDSRHDGFNIRRVAIECNIPTITSLDTLDGIVRILKENVEISNTEVFDMTTFAKA